MLYQIRTLLRHEERKLAPAEKDSGDRHWSAVQLLTPTWFFVECYKESEREIQRWVTTSIRDAARLLEAIEPSSCARIFLCLRAPLSTPDGTLFEEIDEAYQVGPCGPYLFHLSTGTSYAVGTETMREACEEPAEIQLLYSQRRRQKQVASR
jgi:hypothetical protein